MEGDMDNRILMTSKVAVDTSKLVATHLNNKMASQGLMEDDSNTDKVRIHSMLAIVSRLAFDSLITY